MQISEQIRDSVNKNYSNDEMTTLFMVRTIGVGAKSSKKKCLGTRDAGGDSAREMAIIYLFM